MRPATAPGSSWTSIAYYSTKEEEDITIQKILSAFVVIIFSVTIILDQFPALPYSDMPIIFILFGVIIILAIAGSIFGHMDRKKTGRKQEESWHNVLIFELYFIALILILTQLGGDSRLGLNPDSGPFWILLFSATLSVFFSYLHEKKMAEQ